MANSSDLLTSLASNGDTYITNYDTGIGSPFQFLPPQNYGYQLIVTFEVNPVADGVISLFSGTTLIRRFNVKAGISAGWTGNFVGSPIVKKEEAFNVSATTAFTGDFVVKEVSS